PAQAPARPRRFRRTILGNAADGRDARSGRPRARAVDAEPRPAALRPAGARDSDRARGRRRLLLLEARRRRAGGRDVRHAGRAADATRAGCAGARATGAGNSRTAALAWVRRHPVAFASCWKRLEKSMHTAPAMAGRVLVVEDDHDARGAIADLLEQEGHTVVA